MNRFYFLGALAVASVGGLTVVGCGDDTASGGAAAASGSVTSGSPTSTTTSSSKASSGAGTTTTATGSGSGVSGSSGSGASCADQCIADHPDGYHQLAQAVVEECGCKAGSACAAMCSADGACTDDMPYMGDTTTTPCGDCVQAQGDAQSPCATAAATGSHCLGDTDNPDCGAVVTCILGCGG